MRLKHPIQAKYKYTQIQNDLFLTDIILLCQISIKISETFNGYLKWFRNKQVSAGDRCVACALGSTDLGALESRQLPVVGPQLSGRGKEATRRLRHLTSAYLPHGVVVKITGLVHSGLLEQGVAIIIKV